MTKFTDLMNIEKKIREISVHAAAIVGKDRSSTVYRIDPETIVKLYAQGVPLPKIKQEIDLAKKSFCGRYSHTYFLRFGDLRQVLRRCL